MDATAAPGVPHLDALAAAVREAHRADQAEQRARELVAENLRLRRQLAERDRRINGALHVLHDPDVDCPGRMAALCANLRTVLETST